MERWDAGDIGCGQLAVELRLRIDRLRLRYYGLAPAPVKEQITRVLVDVMDYWMRHRYKMHRTYTREL